MIKEYGGKETYKNAKQKAMHEKKETKKTEAKERGSMKASQTKLEKKNIKDAMENKNMRPPFQQKGKVTAVVVKTKSAPSKKPVVKAGAVIKTSPMAMKKKKC
jgi:hypothetical protein